MFECVFISRYLNKKNIFGIKLQLLHVLKETDLATDYLDGKFETLSKEEYMTLLIDCLKNLSPDIVIHRLTGDGPKDLLIAPDWNAHKKWIINGLDKLLCEQNLWQGMYYNRGSE